MQQAVADRSLLLLEATSNQVNQFGGYTGMHPTDFRRLIETLAMKEGLAWDQIILGGDHLGPNPWRDRPSRQAMGLAEEMVAQYAAEGFTKIHLDASMACQDDPATLSPEVVARRSARLCAAAEAVGGGKELLYVIGTEVPTPGGATEHIDALRVTTVADADETLQIHIHAFREAGLEEAWKRVIAMVVQPGVEFNHDSVHEYDRKKVDSLSAWLQWHVPLVFEAHSTDYQQPEAYRELVEDGFAILKVGPAVTFAMREALYALALIEGELCTAGRRCALPEAIEVAMLSAPANWISHYHGTPAEERLLRTFSYSDRLRYYWTEPTVQREVEKLMTNLGSTHIPETLLSAFMPREYDAVRKGQIRPIASALLLNATRRSLEAYARACSPADSI
jgi:D-tagatose-1,6-bisphosphate aldolase subunit GatZ/KbaZ